ncbi:hypothetical protein A2159_03705 [Candidatus Woesebacteria bacterium RBG_13_34_9]|uniref:Pseudouridine synthase n=1 Tax=Candidatus Woesebacteria bacterium RBG_13_34_9 TaxID=1802477 RepID=A0A1F7X0M4_9BACT|nr:MAG: hypothetical protein A2159_03705 [Candidatus Woesebacteria bacterium RBG_13_34_9]
MVLAPKIIFYDESLLVLNKPSGWIVNESQTTKGIDNVVQTWLKSNYKYNIVKNRELRSGIVHRLDKETSGILVVAKTLYSFNNLQMQFKDRIVKKTYLALLHGKLEPSVGEINVPVGRLPWNRRRFGVLPGGRESKTKYKVISYYSDNSQIYSFLEFYPETGRTHQIRIHAKYLGHSIVSDEFYAGRKTAKKDRSICPRLFLHSYRIEFIHPVSNTLIKFVSNIPSDLNRVLKNFKKLD